MLRRLDFDRALESSGENYLIVNATPTLAVRAGQNLEYQISTRSRQGGISYSLASWSRWPERLARWQGFLGSAQGTGGG